ncbi:unnamed protein product [Prunus brigantina]
MTSIHKLKRPRFVKHLAFLKKHKANTKVGSSRPLDHGIMGRGRDHQPLDQSIKCIPRAKKRRTLDQGGGRDLPRFMGVTPPCFTISNADLTTHLPQSDSTMQIFSGPQADLFQPRLALQDSFYKY